MQDVYPGSDGGSWIRIKEFKYPTLTQEIVSKLSEISNMIRIPDPDPDFLPIPDPGYRGNKGTGSRIRISNTAKSSDPKPKYM
jgi:hypothetical protein